MQNNNLRKKNIFLSAQNAWKGFWTALIQEPAFKYMVFSALLVVGAMLYFPTSRTEKAVLLAMIFSVLGLEMINSIMERFLDFLQPNHDPRVKIIKDLLSGFVFLIVIGSAIIGLLIFWPHLKTLVSFSSY
ncbi:diacylglycerol kinase family protein [Patescibacteria group bacterium]|nr:diacylglycerol kinase family protein [Patescibacteria group bacterium]MBU4368016.1 diacylglycerol kinase family protein [Patescibacteria group bacterium]MBU4462251.1 diacylglycerol kinase family protein [Patescibacteria group bacterium]MCG2699607.1 diacylglycerol kinase family protein [Candidatus Parcubacteria bacterium]